MKFDIWNVHYHKKVFHIVDAIFWVLGWGSFGIGIWLYIEKNSFSMLAPSSYSALSTAGLYVIIGAMVSIVAVIGPVGIYLPSKFLLVSYIFFTGLLTIVHMGTGLMGRIQEDSIRHRVKYSLFLTLNRTQKVENYPVNHLAVTWDEMQGELRCCGVDSYKDWFNSSGWPKNNFVPDSCCNVEEFADFDAFHNCGKNQMNHDKWYQEGCFEPFTDWLLQHTKIIEVFSIIFVIVEVIVLVTSIRILVHIRMQEKQRYATVQYRRGQRENANNSEPDCRIRKRHQWGCRLNLHKVFNSKIDSENQFQVTKVGNVDL
uniref:Tetraspanin n=1 Tax=Panagrolaimus sp. JU765 TaxID=591449 RepID=A0AC34PUY5_9BILA